MKTIAAAVMLLPLTNGGRRGFSFARTMLIASLLSCAISHFLPAAMPLALHEKWFADFERLRRTAVPFTINITAMQGVITFPSLHAAMAVIFVYSTRGVSPICCWIGFIALNTIMLISTPVMGFHYFSDVIAGIIVASVSIGLCHFLDKSIPVRA